MYQTSTFVAIGRDQSRLERTEVFVTIRRSRDGNVIRELVDPMLIVSRSVETSVPVTMCLRSFACGMQVIVQRARINYYAAFREWVRSETVRSAEPVVPEYYFFGMCYARGGVEFWNRFVAEPLAHISPEHCAKVLAFNAQRAVDVPALWSSSDHEECMVLPYRL